MIAIRNQLESLANAAASDFKNCYLTT